MISINKKGDVLYLGGFLDDEHSHACIQFVQQLGKRKGTVIINSEGGCQEEGFACYDALQTVSDQLEAIGIGQVQSSAILPFLACHRRFATPSCAFMIHHGTYETPGPTHQREAMVVAKELERLDERYMRIVSAITRQSYETIREQMKHGHVFDADAAQTQGYILSITRNIGGKR